MHRRSLLRSQTTGRRRFMSGALSVAAAMPVLGRFAFGQSQQVNVYNWDTYIGETTLEDLTCSPATTSCSPSCARAIPATT
jgi:spermidine/putrescine transport system substrate-binding protein